MMMMTVMMMMMTMLINAVWVAQCSRAVSGCKQPRVLLLVSRTIQPL